MKNCDTQPLHYQQVRWGLWSNLHALALSVFPLGLNSPYTHTFSYPYLQVYSAAILCEQGCTLGLKAESVWTDTTQIHAQSMEYIGRSWAESKLITATGLIILPIIALQISICLVPKENIPHTISSGGQRSVEKTLQTFACFC